MQTPDTVFLNPQPIPPRAAADYLVSLVAQRELLLENSGVESEWISQIDSAISRFVDEYCGTRPPRPFPPFPFLQLDATAVLTELTIRANGLTEGGLRNGILTVARSIVTNNRSNGQRTQQPTCEDLLAQIKAQDLKIQGLQEELVNAPPSIKGSIARMIVKETQIYDSMVQQAQSLGCAVP